MFRWGILFLAFVLLGCNSEKKHAAHVTHLDPGVAHNFILQQLGNESFQIIDVRTPEEFSTGHIQGAINIDWMHNNNGLLNLNKDNTIMVYCRSGRRSQLAIDYLSQHGFNYLFHIKGGIIQWQKDIKSLIPSPYNEY
jgi:phage shock protein E